MTLQFILSGLVGAVLILFLIVMFLEALNRSSVRTILNTDRDTPENLFLQHAVLVVERLVMTLNRTMVVLIIVFVILAVIAIL